MTGSVRESWDGVLRRVDVGLGAWVLELDSGERIGLYGDIPPQLLGQRVRIYGARDVEVGIGMVGQGLAVSVSEVSKR